MCSPSRTLLPPPFPHHPSGSSQCTSPGHPVSYIEPGQVIHFLYDIIYVSMPFSQIIPPPPQSPKDCSIHQCLFCCLTYRVIVTIFLNSMMRDTGCLGLVHWDDPERWYGDGGGKGVQDGEHMYTHGRFMSMYGKTNTIL